MIGKITYEIPDCTEEHLALVNDIINIMFTQGVIGLKNGSATLFFDDVGLLQKIDFDRTRKRREGETLTIRPQPLGQAILNYEGNGEIGRINYKTFWRRPKDNEKVA